MAVAQTLELRFDPTEVGPPASMPPRTLWKMILLLALKDRADEIWLIRRENGPEFWYRVGGSYEPLVLPPRDLIPAMVGEARDLARPRGWRVALIRVLRATIRLLEGRHGRTDSRFFAWTEAGGVLVDVEPHAEDGVVLRLPCKPELVTEADAILREWVSRWEAEVAKGDEMGPE